MKELYCNLLINNNSRNTDYLYTYLVPEKFQEEVFLGKRVIINFNNRIIVGLITEIIGKTDLNEKIVKPIIGIIDKMPILTHPEIKLGNWIRDYYISRYIDAFKLMFPPSSKMKKYVLILKDIPEEYEESNFLKEYKIGEKIKFDSILKTNSIQTAIKLLSELAEKNIIEIIFEDKFVEEFKNAVISVNEVKKNYCKKRFELYDEQRKIVKIINSKSNERFLINGITGSGKTEIYFELIEKNLLLGKKAIFMLPEISLTSQMIERFNDRFDANIRVFHSKMTLKKRLECWIDIISGNVDIVIGPRSVLFLPIDNIGIIIIDEEHEDSYKSSTMPKYDAVITGIMRASFEKCNIVLGTATPSINTYYASMIKEINILELNVRAKGSEMPTIEVIDMRNELNSGNRNMFSRELLKNIKEALNKKEQIILYINKRGYSSFVSCRNCGYVIKCEKCDVSMTYHKSKNFMICHYCGSAKKLKTECPECGSNYFKTFGVGTQKVETAIKDTFPDSRVARMDFDTTIKINEIEEIYNKFKNNEIDILVGTQMLAKSFDFENVTVVGIISADITINLPFYSSNEKSYQLIVQVSGRCGRGYKKGKVILQTYTPDNYSILYAMNNNYKGFFNAEMKLRKEFVYPPFVDIINIGISSKDETFLKEFTTKKYSEFEKIIRKMEFSKKVLLYKPANNGIYKINNEYKINTTMKIKKSSSNEVKLLIKKIYLNKSYKNIKISIDINTSQIN